MYGVRNKIMLPAFVAMVALQAAGCVFCWNVPLGFTVRGKLLDADTQEPLSNAAAAYGVRSLAGGEEIVYVRALLADGSHNTPYLEDDGSFAVTLSERPFGSCRPFEKFEPARPDQVEVIVILAGCEQRFTIDLGVDTVVDMNFPEYVVQLRDPILVGPCDE